MNLSSYRRTVRFLAIVMAMIVLLAACQQKPANIEVDLAKVIQTVETAPGGWKPQEEPKFFSKDTLFDLMDGQSDAFFVYGFQKAAVQRFNNAAGVTINVSVFQVDASDSAFGLFSVNREQQALAIGNDGSGSPGRRLSFWQDRYFVQMTALKTVPDADLQAAGKAISAGLPKGGERPALMNALPVEGLAADPGPLFFHQELSIQDRVWLGGENRLGLGPETDGALGRYDLSGQPVDLMIIEYPDAAQAEKGLKALQSSEQDDLLAAVSSGKRLEVVFGQADKAAAEALLARVAK
jgi:hypothetical protein